MPRYPQRFWLAAFLVAWSVDLLFWDKSVGISYPIFILFALVGGFALAQMERIRPARFTILLAGLIVLLAGVSILRSEGFTRFINGFLALAMLGLLAMTFQNGGWIHFRVLDYLLSGIVLIISSLTGAFGLRLAPEDQPGGKRAIRQALPFVRGLFLALPVVLLMGALLSSADLIFADRMKAIFISIRGTAV